MYKKENKLISIQVNWPEHTDQIISRKHVENTTEIILILINCAGTVQKSRMYTPILLKILQTTF
jgi:hypothetical protein